MSGFLVMLAGIGINSGSGEEATVPYVLRL